MENVVSAVYARRNFGRLLNIIARTGKEVMIERSGKRIAKLTDLSGADRRHPGKLDLRKIRGLGKSLWRAVDVKDYIERERAQWA